MKEIRRPIRDPDFTYQSVHFWWEESLIGNDSYGYLLDTKNWTYTAIDRVRWYPLIDLWWWQEYGFLAKEAYAEWLSEIVEKELLNENTTESTR